MAKDDYVPGYGTKASRGGIIRNSALHLILLAAGSLFLMPFIWMLSSSLKPLDQTMTLPPTWIPRATLAPLDGVQTVVVRDKEPLAEDFVIAVPQAGHEVGKRQLLPASAVDAQGRALTKYTIAGHEEYEPEAVPVQIVKRCPKGCVRVTEWLPEYSREHEQTGKEPRWDCVPAEQLTAQPHAFFSNYASALARMRDPGDPRPWYNSGFFRYLWNTLWVCVLSVIGAVVSCTLVAYAFAFLDFPGRNVLFALTLAVMMVPFPATMVPLFDVFRSLGWVGSFKPLWAPAWFGGAFFIFLLRQFFLGLPKDLLDAARIDGCGELEILWHVVVPLARPALAMVALFQFLGAWKDFMGPMLYLQDRSQFTLSLGLQAFQSQHGGTPWHLAMAAAMMFSLPLVILFLLARKTFMRGIVMTGMKG
jgi:multiple sugar transport system permease protein